MKKPRFFLHDLAVSACLTLVAGAAQAEEQLVLRQVMNDLGTHMQRITGGIAREDWPMVEKAAHFIATHPQPPAAEKMRIMRFVGTDMAKFKAHDGATHHAAEAVAKAASDKDARGVINEFQKLQTACFNCHNEFRKPLVEHFYPIR